MKLLVHRTHVLWVGLGALLIVGVLLSPLVFAFVASMIRLDWTRLSSVGQSYNAVSALLASLALCGLACTAWLQIRQTKISQLQAVRSYQFDLLRMAMEIPEYRTALGDEFSDLQSSSWRIHAYLNLWFMYLQMSYLTGSVSESGLRRVLSGEMFAGDAGLGYWTTARLAFISEAHSRGEAEFVTIVSDEYEAAVLARSGSKGVTMRV